MCKQIIYGENLKIIKCMCNTTFKTFDKLEGFEIATCLEELFDIHKNNKITLLITSEEYLTINEIKNLVKKIENKIIFCNNPEHHRNTKNILYIPFNASQEYIYNSMEKFKFKFCEKIARIKTRQILEKLHFDFKLNGTNFLLEAIVYSYLHKTEYLFENLEKNIYPQVANICNVSYEIVKWSIVRSVNIMNNHIKNSEFFNNCNEKITPKSLIYIIINRI